MADHPILDMFGDIAPTEGSVLQEIGAIGSAANPGYNPGMSQMHNNSALLPGHGQGAMSSLPQTNARQYGHVASHTQMQQDPAKIHQQPDYGNASSAMGMQNQYAAMNSRLRSNDPSAQSPATQPRYTGGGGSAIAAGNTQYRGQQYPYSANQQYENMQYSTGMMPSAQQHQGTISASQQQQQYTNSWSANSQAQTHSYMHAQPQQTRMSLQQQQQQQQHQQSHPYMNYGSRDTAESQIAPSRQQMAQYPGASISSNVQSQQHIPQAVSMSNSQMRMYHQAGYSQSSQQQQQSSMLSGYGAAQSHPSIPQQSISGYPQTTQSQRPSTNSYYSSNIGSRPTTPQQQPYSHMQGQYATANHISNNLQANDTSRLQQYHSSSSGSQNAVPQNGTMGQNAYFPSPNNTSMLSPTQQPFRSPAQPSSCPPDPHAGSVQQTPNGTPQYRPSVMSPRRPTPPASGSVSPMPPHSRTPERYNSGSVQPPQSTTPLSQGFPSPRQMMSPSGQVSPAPVSQQTSLQQLEQMVMPGPKSADKPDVSHYPHHMSSMSSANIRNGTSPSYNMSHSSMPLQNAPRSNMDNMASHGLSSMINSNNPMSYNIVNPVPQAVTAASQMPVMQHLQSKPMPHNESQLPLNSTNNLSNIQQQSTAASSIFDLPSLDSNESSVVIKDSNAATSSLQTVNSIQSKPLVSVASTNESQIVKPTFSTMNTMPAASQSVNHAFMQSPSHPFATPPVSSSNEISNQGLKFTPKIDSTQQADFQSKMQIPNTMSSDNVIQPTIPSPSLPTICEPLPNEIPKPIESVPSPNLNSSNLGQPSNLSSGEELSTSISPAPVPLKAASPVAMEAAPLPITVTTSPSSITSPTQVSASPGVANPMPSHLPQLGSEKPKLEPNDPVISQPNAPVVGPPQLQIGASPIKPNQQQLMPTLNYPESAPNKSDTLLSPKPNDAKSPQMSGNQTTPPVQPNVSPRLPIPTNVSSEQASKSPVSQASVPQMTTPSATSASETLQHVKSPPSVVPNYMMSPQQKTYEIQQMQTKIQSLCTLPPTPIINKEISDLQDRIRNLQQDQNMPPHGPNPPHIMNQGSPPQPPVLHNQVLSPNDENAVPDAVTPATGKEKKPRKRKEKAKTPKEPKEPKETKTPKTPRAAKTPRRTKRKKSEVETPIEVDDDIKKDESMEIDPDEDTKTDDVVDIIGDSTLENDADASIDDVDGKKLKRRVAKSPKGRSPRTRTRPSSSKKKPLKLPINFGKKKKKRRGSDVSDLDNSPPSSPKVDDDAIQKRRSSRNTKRKKYVDDIDMNLIDDDSGDNDKATNNSKDDDDADAVLIKPTSYFKSVVDEEMIVEKIFNHRMGTRVVEFDEEEDENESAQSKNDDKKKVESDESIKCDESKKCDEKSENDKVPVEEKSSDPEQKASDDHVDIEKVDSAAEKPSNISSEDKPAKKVHTETVQVEEFYVKFRNFSYLHCEWKTFDELEKGDKRIIQKLKRYRQKRAQASFLEDFDEEPFNPLYLEVDRVLDISEGYEDENGATPKHFLVKWQGLPYEESTWELEQDVDLNKIQQFMQFKDPPKGDHSGKSKKQLKMSDWKKIKESEEYKNSNKLREYQLEGVNWLTFCTFNGLNSILADEMGLGKTIQSIAYLVEINKYGLQPPYLVIAPLSTIGNWQREFETWSELNVIVYHGSTASRNMIQEYEMYYKDNKGRKLESTYKFEVLITTFEIIITDVHELKEIPWKCCIIDEAHRLKNRNCKLLEGLRLIQMEQRILLTGTPLQNNVEELFSLLNFLDPVRFASQESFLEEFGDLKTEGQVEKLQAILKPMMLRRLKEDVEKSLAPKEETIVEVELTNIQKKYYRAILERNFAFLSKGSLSSSNVPNLMNTMMELRKCCIHPYLITGAEDQIVREYRQRHEEEDDFSFQAMIHASGKLVLLDKLLPKLKDNGHRVLIFSQMVRCLDLLEDYLVHKRYLYERIDGRVRGNLRQAAIDRFSKPDSDRFAFLLCTRAGGLGINLTAADTVVIFDSDWNPQNDLQAQARCHRIGQEKAVKVYRLICRNTYEREMFDKASKKLGLDKAVLQSMNSAKEGLAPSQQMTKKEIEDLLKKGAYGAIMEDDNAGDQFCEEDIDQILQRRTQVIQLEAGIKGSKFAKASFSSSDTRTDIDIDDPEFWQKWAKKAEVDLEDIDRKNELIMKEPRRRTQTRRYGNEDHLMEISDLDSSDEDSEGGGRRGRSKKNKKGKGRDDDYYYNDGPPGLGNRNDCLKIEKGLLTFGWGRWREILAHAFFKRNINEKHVEDMSRSLILYCSRYYHGDEHIKSFILDLISPLEDAQARLYKNHLGLSNPIPRGRKCRKSKKDKNVSDYEDTATDWTMSEKYDPELKIVDVTYKRHLQRQANRVLLRVRTLFYIRQEVIGHLALQIAEGIHANDIPLPVPPVEHDPPTLWWDGDADKSLLIGTYKHGYQRYNIMRQDPTLGFLARCGPPDGAALLAEINNGFGNRGDDFLDIDKPRDDLYDEPMSPASPGSGADVKTNERPPIMVEPGKAGFPSTTDLNTRLRRLVTSFQRYHKKMELRLAQEAKKLEKREKIEAAFRERELQKRQLQQRRWSRREESDFYKTISTFGVVYLVDQHRYDWNKFRAIARLEKKFDDTLTEYFRAFYAMCKRVCGKKLNIDEEHLPLIVEPITEERATRCIQRIDLLNNLRENIVGHPKLEERLKLCQSSMDLPDWWICGKHDKDLLFGCAKHGLYRTDFHLLHDSSLCFRDVIKNLGKLKSEQEAAAAAAAANAKTDDKSDLTKTSTDKAEIKTEDNKEETDENTKATANSETLKETTDDDKDDKLKVDAVKEEKVKDEKAAETEEPDKNDAADDSSKSNVKEEKKEDVKKEEDKVDKDSQCMDKKSDSCKQEMEDDDRLDAMSQDSSATGQFNNDDVLSQSSFSLEIDGAESNVGQLINTSSTNSIRWPKDKVLQMRLEQVCHAVEKNEWPLPRQMSPTPSNVTRSSTPQQDLHTNSLVEQQFKAAQNDSVLKHHDLYGLSAMAQLDQYAMSLKQSQDNLNMHLLKKRGKKRRRMDIDAERAKLGALLSQSLQAAMTASQSGAFNKSLEEMRRNFPALDTSHLSASPLHSMTKTKSSRKEYSPQQILTTSTPPPAHQHSSKLMTSAIAADTLDLSKKSTSDSPSSAGGGAMDLSSSAGSGSTAASSSSGSSLLKGISLLNKSKNKSKPAPSGPVNGDVGTPARTKPSIDDLALNLQFKKRKKMKEDVKPTAESLKKEEKKSGEFDGSSGSANAANMLGIDAAAQFLSKPGYHPSTAASLLSEFKLASSAFPSSATSERSHSPAEPASDYLDSKRNKKRHKIDPQLLDINKVTGDENVSVVNRLTGKRLTGSKAPTLRELPLWLEQNPMFDVEAKWSHVVKEKGRLPEKLKKRLISPVDKKKKLGIYSDYTSPLLANAAATTSSLLNTPTSNNINTLAGLGMGSLPLLSGFPGVKGSSAAAAAAAAANSASPMFLPFGGLANLGLAANPFFNLAGYGFPNIPGLAGNTVDPKTGKSSSKLSSSLMATDKKSSLSSSGSHGKSSHGSSSKSSSRKASSGSSANNASSSTSGATSSLPFLFPAPGLLYNPMAMGNFNLPQNLPTSFANLAQSGLLNSLVTPPASLSSATTLTPSSLLSSAKPSTSTLSSSASLATHPLMQDDSDDESLKSLMGNHDDDDFPDDDELDNPIPEPAKKSETASGSNKSNAKPDGDTATTSSNSKAKSSNS